MTHLYAYTQSEVVERFFFLTAVLNWIVPKFFASHFILCKSVTHFLSYFSHFRILCSDCHKPSLIFWHLSYRTFQSQQERCPPRSKQIPSGFVQLQGFQSSTDGLWDFLILTQIQHPSRSGGPAVCVCTVACLDQHRRLKELFVKLVPILSLNRRTPFFSLFLVQSPS